MNMGEIAVYARRSRGTAASIIFIIVLSPNCFTPLEATITRQTLQTSSTVRQYCGRGQHGVFTVFCVRGKPARKTSKREVCI